MKDPEKEQGPNNGGEGKEREAQTFRPNLQQWNDLPRYIAYIESTGAAEAGIVKIKAPSGWRPSAKDPANLYNPSNMSFKIPNPLEQHIKPTATPGAFQSTSQSTPELSIENFARLATSQRFVTPGHHTYDELEELYWNGTVDRADDPIYGADVQGTLIDEDRKIWNVDKGENGDLFNDLGQKLTRVDAGAYLYFGMWKTTFSWHIEDMDLYGINYLHYGAPKVWYCVPPDQAYRLERAATELFPQWSVACKNFLRHKVCMMSPKLLATKGITVRKVVQEERDLIVVFPHAYHSGFNHGFNIAEASNFGTPSWVEHGKRHRACMCSDSDKAIHLDMAPFVERFQPDKLQSWRSGKDQQLHPDDPQELEEVFQLCHGIVEGGKDRLPNHLLDRLEGDGEELEEKAAAVVSLCRKQLNHFKMYREVLPQLAKLIDFMEIKDWKEEEEDKENGDTVPEANGHNFCANITLVKTAVRNAKKRKVQVKKLKSDIVREYLAKLPVKPLEVKKKKPKLDVGPRSKMLGFADGISQEELEAKKMMKKCYFKHKFGSCLKCSACLLPDCGRCWACKDKPKFGGPGVQKQKCQEKKCTNPVVRGCDRCTWNLDFLSQTI